MDEEGRREGKKGRATRARPEHYRQPFHHFLLGYGESVEIVSPELHAPHVGGLGKFGDDTELGVETEDGLGRGRERGRKETDLDEEGRENGKRRT